MAWGVRLGTDESLAPTPTKDPCRASHDMPRVHKVWAPCALICTGCKYQRPIRTIFTKALCDVVRGQDLILCKDREASSNRKACIDSMMLSPSISWNLAHRAILGLGFCRDRQVHRSSSLPFCLESGRHLTGSHLHRNTHQTCKY